jgi:hypothetical protein
MNASNTKLKKNCNYNWEHYFNVNGNKIRVCKGFLLNLYQISDKKLRVLKSKISKGLICFIYFKTRVSQGGAGRV